VGQCPESPSILLSVLRVTVDTNVLDRDMARLRAASAGLEVEIAPTTVTLRERGQMSPTVDSAVLETGVWGESMWGSSVWGGPPVFETATIGESRLGMAALGGGESRTGLEAILVIISNGSFPKPGNRNGLSNGQRRQLRDAMILEAHAREKRDVLVTNDLKAFVGTSEEKRSRLETLCRTRIRTVDEFCEEITGVDGERSDRLPGSSA
jgi:hypothetical protein